MKKNSFHENMHSYARQAMEDQLEVIDKLLNTEGPPSESSPETPNQRLRSLEMTVKGNTDTSKSVSGEPARQSRGHATGFSIASPRIKDARTSAGNSAEAETEAAGIGRSRAAT